MLRINRILVITRLAHNSRDALRHGVALANRYQSELSVLRIVSNPVDMEAVNAPSLFIKGEEYKTYLSALDQYREELDKAVRQVARDGISIKQFITDKEPIKEVLRIVKEEKIDLIITLAHDEWRIEHTLFGGENDELIRRMPCSILLVKHQP